MPDSQQKHAEKLLRKPIRKASENSIIDALYNLKNRQFKNNQWIGRTNRYKTKTTNRFDKDFVITKLPNPPGTPPNTPRRKIVTPAATFKKDNILQYVAVSTILHCHDGWGFLSKSIKSLLDGDIHTCVHLAYYSELRATMSLFAGNGIGIFSNNHIWFDNLGNPNFITGLGTHKFAEYGINLWAKTTQKSGNLLNVIKVNSVTIFDWLSSATPGFGISTFTSFTREWLKTWSLDLKTFGKDHNIRNLASYRPQELQAPVRQPIKEIIEKLIGFWEACEPTGYGQFGLLDLYLLRHSLETVYQVQSGDPTRGVNYGNFVSNAISNLGLNSVFLENFLSKRTLPDNHLVFIEAEKGSLLNNQIIDPIPMLARAILLLRLSTAVTSDLLEKGTVEKTDLQFWWDTKGKETGLWSNVYTPTNMSDLWEDIRQIIDDINTWLPTAAADACILDSRTEIPFQLWGLSKFQLAGFWGMWD